MCRAGEEVWEEKEFSFGHVQFKMTRYSRGDIRETEREVGQDGRKLPGGGELAL